MVEDMYREKILDHYRNPRNYGELNDPEFSHTGENEHCGDEITVEISLDEAGDVIDSIAFRGEGCAIAQASASLVTQELEGEPVERVVEMEREDVIDILGIELTPMRVKCAMLIEKVATAAVTQRGQTDTG